MTALQTQAQSYPTVKEAAVSAQRPLKIVHIVSSLLVGGMEHFVLRLASAQQEQGHQVTIIGLKGGPLEDEAEIRGLKVRTLEGDKFSRISKAMTELLLLRPDIVNSHNPSSLHYALLAKLMGRAKVVMVRHGMANKPLSPIQWRFTDAVVAVSVAAAKRMWEDCPDHAGKITVVRNGVEFSSPRYSREKVRRDLGIGADELTAIVVARLDRMKGHAQLIRALPRLMERNAPLTLLVAGDGPESERLESLVKETGIPESRVRFLGYRRDISDLLNASDLFVLPSLTEGLPLSVLEAMAQRLPVVATAVGGIPEIITNGEDGLLVPADNTLALANALESLVRDPALRSRLGEAGYRRAWDNFSFRKMADEYEQLYSSLR